MTSEIAAPPAIVMAKQLARLDAGCVTILANSPIAGFGYLAADGHRRATFVGGTPGFARVHSPGRISFALPAGEPPPADRTGVSFVFLLPGIGETLRVNGAAAGRKGVELTVDVREAYVHCARCVLRSRLWHPIATRTPDFLAAAPFLVLSTGDRDGGSDTSPRGDEPGFARRLDDTTLAIPDRRGNRRADTLRNLEQDDRIAFAALRPHSGDVLHGYGTATRSTDPALLATMTLRGVPPQRALLIHVEAMEARPSEAVRRSRLWSPSSRVDTAAVPDLIALAARHGAINQKNLLGLLMRRLAGWPRLTRRIIDLGYCRQLRQEGYTHANPTWSTPAQETVPPPSTGRIVPVTYSAPTR
ncbi:pyridoxamine 5'-phosphate oxidase family protein [Dactylosporangium sp. NPDC051541]|uniref:pyridoxamine 5'-phosphate oxidase family protein n=1 Tax=Dactylosporangium sp. NPDC051541 TaxID=3363977 RepID=UPI00379BCD3A